MCFKLFVVMRKYALLNMQHLGKLFTSTNAHRGLMSDNKSFNLRHQSPAVGLSRNERISNRSFTLHNLSQQT